MAWTNSGGTLFSQRVFKKATFAADSDPTPELRIRRCRQPENTAPSGLFGFLLLPRINQAVCCGPPAAADALQRDVSTSSAVSPRQPGKLLPFQTLQRHFGVPPHPLSLLGRKEIVGCLLAHISVGKYKISFGLAIDFDCLEEVP